MTVYLAFSFDTEQPQLLDYLPEYIIKKEEYLKLDKESKKLIWADYIREGIWRDSDLFKRSQSELETILELNELFSEFNGKVRHTIAFLFGNLEIFSCNSIIDELSFSIKI